MAREDFNNLLWFLAVAEERSFTRAAAKLRNCPIDAQPHHQAPRGAHGHQAPDADDAERGADRGG